MKSLLLMDKWLIFKDTLTLSLMILSITIPRITILSIMTLRTMALIRTILSMMALGMTHRIYCRDAECQIFYCYADCHIFIVMQTVILPSIAAQFTRLASGLYYKTITIVI